MPLTSLPLIFTAAALTAVCAAVTVSSWRRGYLARIAGVLLTEVLLVLTVGLAVNRSQEFYPTWESIAVTAADESSIARIPDGRLDVALRERATPGSPTVVPWQPAEASTWHLGAPATLAVPAGYLDSASAYPVVLALAAPGRHPDAAAVTAMLRGAAGPAVMLVTPVTSRTTAADLAVAIPARIGTDVRVTGHAWALVAPLAQAPAAIRAVTTAPGRFAALALVADTADATWPAGVALPHTVATVLVRPGGKPPTTGAATTRTVPAGEQWPAAVRWAIGQTPAPLTQPAVLTPLPSKGAR